jgi:excisionase family DNA binding protein
MNRRETIESVLRLTRAERSLRGDALNDIRLVRERLESTLGGTVRPSEAARLLGVSRPSMKRWLDSGDIPTVLTRGGRRELPIAELGDLLLETEEMRQAGRERVLGAVIRARRERASELDVDALLPPHRPRTHRQAELQSLAYHRLVADRLTPELVAEALRTVERWEGAGQLDPRWASEWRRLLERPLPEVRRALRSDSKPARELRQTSPFVGVITEQERRRIIETVEARW